MTPDLDRLRASLAQLHPVLSQFGLELVDDPNWPEPSDTSYLNGTDRADSDIMANVEAMAATNKLIAWFGREHEAFVGLWRGPTNLPLERAPIVRLDTEGQYSIVAATVADYVAVSVNEEAFDTARAALMAVGFTVAPSDTEIWRALKGLPDDPQVYRHELYNQGRVRRGLAPV